MSSATHTETVTSFVVNATRLVKDGQIEKAMGRGATNRVVLHFKKLNAQRPNKLGGARTNYFAKAAANTSYTFQPGRFTISVNQVGINQRIHGGEIVAKKAKYLTIPAAAEAYGHRAREFNDLKVGFARNQYGAMQLALVKASRSTFRLGRGRRDGSRGAVKQTGSIGGDPMYWLTPRVFQRADPTVAPSPQEIFAGAQEGADLLFKTLDDRKAARAAKGGAA